MVGLSVAVVVFGAAAFPAPLVAAADSVGSARAQVQSLQQQVVDQAGRIRFLTLAYEQADTRAGALAEQVTTDEANLARLQTTVSAAAAQLRTDALLSYTGGVTNAPSGTSGSADPSVRLEYLQVATGDLTDAVDRYRTQEAQVAAAEASLAAEWRNDRAAVRAADGARMAALAEAGRVQAELVSVQSRLQQLEVAQADAAAAAARAAARVATAPRPAPPTQGLPVRGGLVTVVHSVVGPSAAPAGGEWLQLRQCESGDDYQANTGNGFYGAYQFSAETWTNMGYPGRPDLEPPSMQDQAAQRLQAQSGWGQWPACSAALGLH